MKLPIRAATLAIILTGAMPLTITAPAYAGNSSIEATLQGFGDLSMFYQAMLNTGVINSLNENQHYTIFAPTNSALAVIDQQEYPCFYTPQCRPQIAALLRDHILMGHHDQANLITYGQGITTAGGLTIHVQQPFVDSYSVDHRMILSKSEVNGNIIYRIDGVLANQQDLNVFTTMPVKQTALTPQKYVTTQRTVTTYAPAMPPQTYPAGTLADVPADNYTETTKITEHTTVMDNSQ